MESLFVLFFVLGLFSVAQGAIDKKEALEILTKCKKETGASEDVEETFKTQTIPESPEGKCMMACVLREKGLMKGDKVDAQAVTDFFEKTYKDDPDKLEQFARAVAVCITTDVSGMDKCDVAVAYMKCGKKLNFKL